jgi:RNA-directed DNA polymerase
MPWKQGHRHVVRLHKRMDRATPRGEVRGARQLQTRLVQSWSARLVAVRRISQDHRGKKTAGVDGGQLLTPAERWRLATVSRLDGNAPPRRRTWRPQAGSAEKRPRGLPTPGERARQTGVRHAWEPAWEAKRSPHPSGCRPGRSCGEALGARFIALQAPPQYALTAASHKGVERLDHAALRAKPQASPGMRRQRNAWLQAGSMAEHQLCPLTAGTPPGGAMSPCWP